MRCFSHNTLLFFRRYSSLSFTCFHMIASYVVFCMLSVTWFYLDAISHMLTCFGNCQLQVVMDADSHMLSCWKLSCGLCQSHVVMDADSHMLSWILTVTCCHVGNCQLHVVMWALSVTCCHGWWHSHAVMNAVSHCCVMLVAVSHISSWMPTVTCGHGCCQSLVNIYVLSTDAVFDAGSLLFVMLMLSVKCCQILAAKTHNIFFTLSSVHGCWQTYVVKRMPSLTAYLQSFLFVYTHKRRTWVLH